MHFNRDRIFRSKNNNKVLSQEKVILSLWLYYDDDKTVDEVMVVIMRAPSTYTRRYR